MFRDTHKSKSDPKARIYHKSRWTPGLPSYLGHVITEDKNGLIVGACVTEAIKRAERGAGLAMRSERKRRDRQVTLAADRNYQERTFIEGLRELGVIPLIAEYKGVEELAELAAAQRARTSALCHVAKKTTSDRESI